MKIRQLRVIIFGALVVSLGVLCVYIYVVKATSGTMLQSVNQSKDRINALDLAAVKFASTTRDIFGQSTEGGEQIDFLSNGQRMVAEQRFYGETGRSYMRYYYDRGNIFAITKLNLSYEVPIYVDPSAAVKSSEKKEFFVDNGGQVCHWFLNDTEKVVDKETIEMIHQYISGVLP
jgi:hypothetical protein